MLKFVVIASVMLGACLGQLNMPSLSAMLGMGGMGGLGGGGAAAGGGAAGGGMGTSPMRGSGMFNFGRFSMNFNQYLSPTSSLQQICNDALLKNGGAVGDYLSDVMGRGVNFMKQFHPLGKMNPLSMVQGSNSAQWGCLLQGATNGFTNMGNMANGVADYFDTVVEHPIRRMMDMLGGAGTFNPCQTVFCGEGGMTPLAMMNAMMHKIRTRQPLGNLGASIFGKNAVAALEKKLYGGAGGMSMPGMGMGMPSMGFSGPTPQAMGTSAGAGAGAGAGANAGAGASATAGMQNMAQQAPSTNPMLSMFQKMAGAGTVSSQQQAAPPSSPPTGSANMWQQAMNMLRGQNAASTNPMMAMMKGMMGGAGGSAGGGAAPNMFQQMMNPAAASANNAGPGTPGMGTLNNIMGMMMRHQALQDAPDFMQSPMGMGMGMGLQGMGMGMPPSMGAPNTMPTFSPSGAAPALPQTQQSQFNPLSAIMGGGGSAGQPQPGGMGQFGNILSMLG